MLTLVIVVIQQTKLKIFIFQEKILFKKQTTQQFIAEKIYKTNFTEQSKKFVLSLHYNGDNSYLFVNGSQESKFKSSVNYLDRNLLCVDNISSNWSLTNGTKLASMEMFMNLLLIMFL